MSNDDLSPAIRELIARHIRSMDHAEAALILADERDRTHSVGEIAENRRWATETAIEVLDGLAASGFAVRSSDGYRLAAGATDVATLSAFADLYRTRPVTLVHAIYSTPLPVRPVSRLARPDDF